MAKIIGSDLDFQSAARITNLPDPNAAQQPATKAYVDSAVEGLNWKDNVRVASVGNINLAAPGATIDGVSMSAGDRFLPKDQSSQPANGIYIWNGAAVAATRAPDANTAVKLEQAVVTVDEGTSAGASFRQQTVNFTLDSGNVVWGAFGTAVAPASETVAGKAELATQAETDAGTDDQTIVTPLKAKTASWMVRKYATTIGDGAATSFTVTHNLNTKNVAVEIYLTGGTFDQVFADVKHTTVNTLTIVFAAAPSASQYTVVVIG